MKRTKSYDRIRTPSSSSENEVTAEITGEWPDDDPEFPDHEENDGCQAELDKSVGNLSGNKSPKKQLGSRNKRNQASSSSGSDSDVEVVHVGTEITPQKKHKNVTIRTPNRKSPRKLARANTEHDQDQDDEEDGNTDNEQENIFPAGFGFGGLDTPVTPDVAGPSRTPKKKVKDHTFQPSSPLKRSKAHHKLCSLLDEEAEPHGGDDTEVTEVVQLISDNDETFDSDSCSGSRPVIRIRNIHDLTTLPLESPSDSDSSTSELSPMDPVLPPLPAILESESGSDEEAQHPMQNENQEFDSDDDELIARAIDPTEIPHLEAQYINYDLLTEVKLVSCTEFSVRTYVERHQTHQQIVQYKPGSVEQFRHTEGRYDLNLRAFVFPVKQALYWNVLGILGIVLNDYFENVISALSRYGALNSNKVLISEENSLRLRTFTRLADYQRESVEFALKRQGRVMFADESGMGKTAEAIISSLFYQKEWPMIIMCSTNLQDFWVSELRNWLPKEKAYKILSLRDIPACNEFADSDSDSESTTPDIVIIGYPLLLKLKGHPAEKTLKDQKFRVLILDDCHKIKHSWTKTSKSAMSLIRKAKRRFLLTSNAAFGVPVELFRQLHVIDRVAFKNYRQFADRYCGTRTYAGRNGEMVTVPSSHWRDAKNLAELKQLIFGTVVTRHFKQSQSFYLPQKKREKVILHFEPDLRSRRILGRLLDSSRKDLDDLTSDPNPAKGHLKIFKWYRKSGNAKLPMICAYLDQLDLDRKKVLIYYRHNCVLEGIKKLLNRKNIEYVHIAKDFATREDLCSQFNCDDSIRVALLNVCIANVDVDLRSADTVVFTEFYWVPDTVFMNEDRACGPLFPDVEKPNRNIDIKYLVAVEPEENYQWASQVHIDGHLWELLAGKMNILTSLGLLNENFIHDGLMESRFQPEIEISDDFSPMSSDNSGNESSDFDPDSDYSEESSDGGDGDLSEVRSEDMSDYSSDSDPDSDSGYTQGDLPSQVSQEIDGGQSQEQSAECSQEIPDEESESQQFTPASVETMDEDELSSGRIRRPNVPREDMPTGRPRSFGDGDNDNSSNEEEDSPNSSDIDFIESNTDESDPDLDYCPSKKKSKKKRKKKHTKSRDVSRSPSERPASESDDSDSDSYAKKVVKSAKGMFL